MSVWAGQRSERAVQQPWPALTAEPLLYLVWAPGAVWGPPEARTGPGTLSGHVGTPGYFGHQTWEGELRAVDAPELSMWCLGRLLAPDGHPCVDLVPLHAAQLGRALHRLGKARQAWHSHTYHPG